MDMIEDFSGDDEAAIAENQGALASRTVWRGFRHGSDILVADSYKDVAACIIRLHSDSRFQK